MRSTLRAATWVALFVLSVGSSAQIPSLNLRIDAFGYRPLDTKTVVLRRAMTGYDAPDGYIPGASIEIRRAANGQVAFAGPPVAWQSGAVHAQSGDRVWTLDFSALTEVGVFYVFDPANGASSETFAIAPTVYDDALRQALRMFYYQRCGTPKAVPHAEPAWADTACHVGPQQDLDCRLVTNPQASTSRDLSGGRHDAGDYNKYVNFVDDPIHDLLYAYENRPEAWFDDLGIPESLNGRADILDEAKWDLDWLLRMQNADGSVLHKVSVTQWIANSPPSTDNPLRRYAPATASATISACGAFAHGARVFLSLPDSASQSYGQSLQSAATAAWGWLAANPSQIPSNYSNAGFVNVAAEDSAYDQAMNRVVAAIHLFALTGQTTYRSLVDADYSQAHLLQWQYALMYEHNLHQALLLYSTLDGATPSVAAAIRSAFAASMSGSGHLSTVLAGTDPYRAFLSDNDYVWSSNRVKALQALDFLAMNRFGLDTPNARRYLDAGADYLHYLHGVGPTGFTFLTNMAAHGAPRSVTETYHAWFADGTIWDNAQTSLFGPPPGFLTGGPNKYFAPDPSYSGPALVPPMSQPPQKSYRDWNTSWPENSWELTECQIAYQGAYVRLLSEFAVGQPARLSLSITNFIAGQTASFTLGGARPADPVAILWSLARDRYLADVGVWTVDLGLDLAPDPLLHVLALAAPGPQGTFTLPFSLPPGTTGISVLFQATQAGAFPEPTQSAVFERTVL